MLLFFWSNSSKGTCGIPKPVNHQRSPTWPLETPGNRCWILQTRPNPRKLRLGESSWGQKLISCIIHTKEESPRKNRDVIYIITDLLWSHFIHVFSFPFRNKTSRTKSIVFSRIFTTQYNRPALTSKSPAAGWNCRPTQTDQCSSIAAANSEPSAGIVKRWYSMLLRSSWWTICYWGCPELIWLCSSCIWWHGILHVCICVYIYIYICVKM
jgi:hypothetical protein